MAVVDMAAGMREDMGLAVAEAQAEVVVAVVGEDMAADHTTGAALAQTAADRRCTQATVDRPRSVTGKHGTAGILAGMPLTRSSRSPRALITARTESPDSTPPGNHQRGNKAAGRRRRLIPRGRLTRIGNTIAPMCGTIDATFLTIGATWRAIGTSFAKTTSASAPISRRFAATFRSTIKATWREIWLS